MDCVFFQYLILDSYPSINGRYGTLCIRENPGCLFIATNRDAVTHLTDAQEWAGLLLLSLLQIPP